MKIAHMRTNGIGRRGAERVSNSIPAQKYEEPFSDQPLEQTVAAGPWTLPQQRLLAILQHPEYRNATVTEICR